MVRPSARLFWRTEQYPTPNLNFGVSSSALPPTAASFQVREGGHTGEDGEAFARPAEAAVASDTGR